ncbi:DUF547 domain-containing protein [Pseudoalteromonas agarivorans]|uniref:Uncharacterized protein n=1 Tax=Pseudoalteromonas agarivorans DSM 14585 TaxID=1312369 RepID=A0ACA8DX45_9GAMM|nr:DUF547 domain-containing protein [Pseudoalteromonas agarivorans]ATC82772.1 hypothetical protein PAGA_a2505 [Pseudoalteromonas agarivorans DSM 14585]
MYKWLLLLCLTTSGFAFAGVEGLPKEFADFSINNDITVSYDDLDQLLKLTVLDTGRSDRKKASKSQALIGTKMRSSRKKNTKNEANRFFFEEVSKSEISEGFNKIRISLESLPNEIALNNLSLNEQLAYWLNLYNTAVVEQLLKHYPVRDTEKLLFGKNSILEEKFLSVSGHALSLNDIQKIVFKKFTNKPIVMYGFYQGNIGSPNLRAEAYSGKKVFHQLEDNGDEFVNSNRGLYIGKKNRLYVSKYFEQTKPLFENFETDLHYHLEKYVDTSMRYNVKNAKSIRFKIEDWSITDIFGTERVIGGSSATNNAAMLNAVVSNSTYPKGAEGSGSGVGAVNLNFISDSITNKTMDFGRFSADQIEKLKALKLKTESNSGTVNIKDLSTDKSEN